MSIFKRFGSKKQKYEFYITIHNIHSKFSAPVQCKVQWKRSNSKIGKKISETSEFLLHEQCEINQTLTMENTIYEKSSGPLCKEAKLQVLYYASSWELYGTLILDLSQYTKTQVTEKVFKLQDCKDKYSTISLSILTKYSQDKQRPTKISQDELIHELNDTKNTLALYKNELDQLIEEKNMLKNELQILQNEFQAIEDTTEDEASLNLEK